jgi:hypothetical protein
MPETFYDYLSRSPEVFSWYCTLTGPDALEFENDCRLQFEVGRSVAVHIPQPIVDIFEHPSPYSTDSSFILYPPADGFIRVPSVPANWIATSQPQRRYTIFVPYHCFQTCATCLETPDLRTVLVRVIRVLRYLDEPTPGPYDYIVGAEKWRNCRQALVRYGICCAEEYVRRGGSNKVLEYLKLRVRRREWHKPNWVYDTNELEHHREHLMYRSYKRATVKTIRWLQAHEYPSISATLGFTSLLNLDERDLDMFWRWFPSLMPNPGNFYSQYNWYVQPHRGNFE